MPVENEEAVRFADEAGIQEALGISEMAVDRRIPAGIVRMSNEEEAVVHIDRDYLLGPESAHINISGISGLATKTSYAMFLIQSVLQNTDADDIAVILLNVKYGDLLQIDKEPPALDEEQKRLWIRLGLEPRPFDSNRVHYLLPRAKNGQANCFLRPDNYGIYAYSLTDCHDKLDLLFSLVPDPSDTIDSLIGEISNGLQTRAQRWRRVTDWNSLLNGPPLAEEGRSQSVGDIRASSVGKFRRHLRRIVDTRQTGVFVPQRTRNETTIDAELRRIEGGHTYVVDIMKLSDVEQSLVFGNIIRTVYDLFAESDEVAQEDLPEKVIIFVDELNKFAPTGHGDSPLIQQILDISERGRSLGLILFSAQQFMSAVHPRVTGNCATKVIGRSSSSEILLPDYRFLDQDIRMSLTRLKKGELLLSHAIFRQPVKIVFPKPAYRQTR
jgi:DNA helicase HerA-like ATPase